MPLIPYLDPESSFCEPCAGKGQLVEHLEKHGFDCAVAYDIEPRYKNILKIDAIDLTKGFSIYSDYIITNPPWTRQILHPLIEVFRNITTTWLLIDADWMQTKQASPYLDYCSLIVSIGRVRWIPDSPYDGKDNCCWYRFGKDKTETIFKGR